jgi:6-phosphofructokinase 1
MPQNNNKKRLGIVVSGGPAPGINSVIHSAVIEAEKLGYESFGFEKGFKNVCEKGTEAIRPLKVKKVSRIANTGGSVLGTSRFNPLGKDEDRVRFLVALKEAKIQRLIVIGGEGSAYLSYLLDKEGFQVIHVPKTIDNDLPLPNNYPSFGFESAREVGSQIVDTLMTDAKTCQRWYLSICMGRQAGFLALGLGLASGATLTLIPEEFGGRLYSLDEMAEIVFESIQLRYQQQRRYGVALLAEGLLDRIDPASCSDVANTPRDHLGRISYSELELSSLLIPLLRDKCEQAGLDVSIRDKTIGYELRCAPPTPFDIEYTKFLGLGAAELIDKGTSGHMVIRSYDNLGSIPLSALIDGEKLRARTVDLESDFYRVARSFMIR